MLTRIDSEQEGGHLPGTFPQFWFGDWVKLRGQELTGLIYGVELITSSHGFDCALGWWYRIFWHYQRSNRVAAHELELEAVVRHEDED